MRTREMAVDCRTWSWLGLVIMSAALGCADPGGDAATGPEQQAPDAGAAPPLRPGTDPMKIGQQTPPTPTNTNTDPKATTADMVDRSNFPDLGATSFETAKQIDESGRVVPNGSPAERADGDVATGTAAPGAAPAPSTPAAGNPGMPVGTAGQVPPTAPTVGMNAAPDAAREIIEADVVQAQGNVLYVLNRYRGLVLIDMSMPDSPFVIGRVPFQAQPVDMYLRNGKAYIVMSDHFSYWQFDSDSDPLGFHGSQVLVVDVQDSLHPQTVGSFNVQGEITDTRIVGDVLYAVSKRNPEYWRYDTQEWHDTTWVLSINIADPAKITKVEEKEFPGAANIIQVYSTALSIAAIDPNYYLVDSDNARQTLITYVDISDPKGAIRVGGKAYVPGAVADKFKMDLDAGNLRVISNNWYWQAGSAATLTIFDASDPSKLAMRSQIPLTTDVANSQVLATRLSGPGLYMNLCWWVQAPTFVQSQACRLDVYNLADPNKPSKTGALEVDARMTHLEAHGDRMLALGARNAQNFGRAVQVSLFDIKDLNNVRRLSTAEPAEASSSSALSDYKAFKVFADLGMVLLPLNWVENPTTQQARSFNGAQIIDWKNDQLVVRGRVAQRGNVERVISFKERVISISESQIQVIDATNRDLPVQTANLFLVRRVSDVFSIKGYQVQLGADEEDSSYRFFVLPFGEDDMAKSVAELPVGANLFYTMQDGDIVRLIGYDQSRSGQVIRNADFSDPTKPRFRGEYRIPAEIQHIYSGCNYGGYCSFYDYYWSPNAGQPLNKKLLPVTVREVNTGAEGRRFYQNFLRLIDLTDPDNPRLAQGSVEMEKWPFVNRVGHGNILFSVHTEPALDAMGNPKQYHERYFLDRIDASNPDQLKALPKVSIPGKLVDIDASGSVLYTVDYQWDEFGRRRNSFNVLSLTGDTATLKSVLPVGDEIDRARYLDREVWLSSQGYPWWGRKDDSPDSRQPYTRLTRLRFNEQAELLSNDSHDIAGYHFSLLDVDGPRVYLSTSRPSGVLILDTTNFADPKVVGAARTIGYVSKLVRDGAFLYLPMGSYGVRRVQMQ